MREIDVLEITQAVRDLCIQANKCLPDGLCRLIRQARDAEEQELPRAIMGDIADNLDAAEKLDIPICQDTGMAVVFAEVGRDVHLSGPFEEAIHEGVRRGYTEGLLRCSVVRDPLRRINIGDNTPAVIHTRIVEGDHVKLTVAPKGFGSENMSAIRMFTPAASESDIVEYVVHVMQEAGSNPCPPVVLGIGIGGDFEQCALLAKTALCRDTQMRNPDPFYARLEERILTRLNALEIGPQGFGGRTTALCVNIEAAPTHIAGLPVAVNVGCHVTRHASKII